MSFCVHVAPRARTTVAERRDRSDVTRPSANQRASSSALPRGRVTERELRARGSEVSFREGEKRNKTIKQQKINTVKTLRIWITTQNIDLRTDKAAPGLIISAYKADSGALGEELAANANARDY